MDVEVFDIDFWHRAEVSDCLHRCLDFLSGDSWDIHFTKAPLRIDLYRRYRREWLLLTKRALQEDWKWSQMVVPPQTTQVEMQYA